MSREIDGVEVDQLRAEFFGDTISVDDAVAVVEVDRTTILKWLREGRIEGSFKVGNRWCVNTEGLRNYVRRPPKKGER